MRKLKAIGLLLLAGCGTANSPVQRVEVEIIGPPVKSQAEADGRVKAFAANEANGRKLAEEVLDRLGYEPDRGATATVAERNKYTAETMSGDATWQVVGLAQQKNRPSAGGMYAMEFDQDWNYIRTSIPGFLEDGKLKPEGSQ